MRRLKDNMVNLFSNESLNNTHFCFGDSVSRHEGNEVKQYINAQHVFP